MSVLRLAVQPDPMQYRRRRTDVPGVGSRDSDRVSSKYDSTTQRIEVWSPWGQRGLPGSAAFEAAFLDRLQTLVAEDPRDLGLVPEGYQRHHVTALITALRDSVTADQMLQRAPGLHGAVLLRAYNGVEQRRTEAALAWNMIVSTPSVATIAHAGWLATRLVPAAMSHVHAFVRRNPGDAHGLAQAVGRINGEIQVTNALAADLEAALAAENIPRSTAQQIGDLLYDRYGEGIWSRSTFMSTRVGTLVPARLATLLDEHCAGPRFDSR